MEKAPQMLCTSVGQCTVECGLAPAVPLLTQPPAWRHERSRAGWPGSLTEQLTTSCGAGFLRLFLFPKPSPYGLEEVDIVVST